MERETDNNKTYTLEVEDRCKFHFADFKETDSRWQHEHRSCRQAATNSTDVVQPRLKSDRACINDENRSTSRYIFWRLLHYAACIHSYQHCRATGGSAVSYSTSIQSLGNWLTNPEGNSLAAGAAEGMERKQSSLRTVGEITALLWVGQADSEACLIWELFAGPTALCMLVLPCCSITLVGLKMETAVIRRLPKLGVMVQDSREVSRRDLAFCFVQHITMTGSCPSL